MPAKGYRRVLPPGPNSLYEYPSTSIQGMRYRFYLIDEVGRRTAHEGTNKAEVLKRRKAIEPRWIGLGAKTVGEALDEYHAFLVDPTEAHRKRVSRPHSAKHTVEMARMILCDDPAPLPDGKTVAGWSGNSTPLRSITEEMAQDLYLSLRTRKKRKHPVQRVDLFPPEKQVYSVDTHRHALAQARSFFEWCVDRGLLDNSPFRRVKGRGECNPGGLGRGKVAVRWDDVRRFVETAVQAAEAGREGAAAGLMALSMGTRAQEITRRVVADVDQDGHVLVLDHHLKTANSKRRLPIDGLVRKYVLRACEGKKPTDPLFAWEEDGQLKHHPSSWPRQQIQRLCKEAGLPIYTCHMMRGLVSDLMATRGAGLIDISSFLGHADTSTTAASYANRDLIDQTERLRLMRQLIPTHVAPHMDGSATEKTTDEISGKTAGFEEE